VGKPQGATPRDEAGDAARTVRSGVRIWVARPEADARRTAARLRALGHVPLVAPVLAVAPTGAAPPPGPFAAVLLTSANALAALDAGSLAALVARAEGIPVFAVGARTAEAAGTVGLAAVTAGGNAAALAAEVARCGLPAGARLLHVTGCPRKAEPAHGLTAAGFAVTAWETYATRAYPVLPAPVAEALGAGGLDAALHYSRRSSATALALAEAAGHGAAFRALAHHCLSADAAAPLVAAGIACHVVAARPEEAALLAGLAPPAGAPGRR
jgi:uroporphyrinogen-III synthase